LCSLGNKTYGPTNFLELKIGLTNTVYVIKCPPQRRHTTMALLSSIISSRELAALNEHQLDVLVSALDAEILQNAAVRKAVTQKVQGVHKSLAADISTKTGGTKGGTKG
jgi:hypothetical protein